MLDSGMATYLLELAIEPKDNKMFSEALYTQSNRAALRAVLGIEERNSSTHIPCFQEYHVLGSAVAQLSINLHGTDLFE